MSINHSKYDRSLSGKGTISTLMLRRLHRYRCSFRFNVRVASKLFTIELFQICFKLIRPLWMTWFLYDRTELKLSVHEWCDSIVHTVSKRYTLHVERKVR